MSDSDDRTRNEKDTAYAPGSEREIEQKQDRGSALGPAVDEDIDDSAVKTAPGTGGPDDVGEIEVDEDDLNLPGRQRE